MKAFLIKNHRWVPLLLLGICIGTYGVYLSQLGYYWDDWIVINFTSRYETAREIEYFLDRPIHAWLDIISRATLGAKPFNWHITTLLIRWLCVWSMWEVVRRIWPKQIEASTWMALFFSVYPIFFQQLTATLFRPHWIAFSLFFLSLMAMIHAYRNKENYWLYTLLGMLAMAVDLFTVEYIAGLEMTRPIILWLILSPQLSGWKEKIMTVVKNWVPYVFVFFIFIGYRIIFFPVEEDPNPLITFEKSSSTAAGLLDLAMISLKDVLHVLVTSWSDIIHPDVVISDSPGNLLAWGIGIAIGVAVYFILRSIKENHPEEKRTTWEGPAILFGLFSVFVGLIPVWITKHKILVGLWSDRFSIPALFGASIFLVAFLNLMVYRRKYRLIAFSVLLGIAISAQIRTANDFRWDWVRQTRLYWQMYWRAPAIEPYTPVIGDGAMTATVNRYNAAFALNVLYPQDEDIQPHWQTYWYFEIPYNNLYKSVPELLQGKSLQGDYETEKFIGDSKNSIMINTPELEDQCLWVLTPRDKDNNKIMGEASELTPIINLDRILPEPISDEYPNEDIFGQEPKHGWCYYFQKASLARQFEDWEEINRLWKEAKQSGYQTAYTYEVIPFVEAFIHLEDWDQAVKLSIETQLTGMHKNLMLCASWEGLGKTFGGSEAFDLAYTEVAQELNCP